MPSIYKLKATSPQRDVIYERLKKAIVDGEVKPGEKLVETEYAEAFGVSRTPVREAIRMLESDGLVNYIPQKGTVVKPLPTKEELEQLYTIRGALQVVSAESIIQNITEDEVEQLNRFNGECMEAIERSDADAFFKALGLFNETLTNSCRVPLLIRLLNEIDTFNPSTAFEKSVPTQLRRMAYDDVRKAAAVQEHIDIYNAIRNRNLDELREAIRYHSANGKKAALTGYEKMYE